MNNTMAVSTFLSLPAFVCQINRSIVLKRKAVAVFYLTNAGHKNHAQLARLPGNDS
jgi:hypothetical protein